MRNILSKTFQSLSKASNILKEIPYKAGYTDILKNIELNRIPLRELSSLPRGVQKNAVFPAGKIIEFSLKEPNYKENLEFIAFYGKKAVLKNMPQCGIAGVDVYAVDEENLMWVGTISPPNETAMEGKLHFYMEKKMYSNFLLVLPSYAVVKSVFVNAKAEVKDKWFDKNVKIAFYGSSITQGCAASRPSLNYVNKVALDTGYKTYNFGFSESAHGEPEVMKMVAEKDTDIIVMEYDHNASVLELSESHLEAYKTLRKYNSHALIVFMSRFSGGISESITDTEKRVETIRKTLDYAFDAGDKKVVFVNGMNYMEHRREDFFADDRHQNDAGHRRIAEIIESVIKAKGVGKIEH